MASYKALQLYAYTLAPKWLQLATLQPAN